MPHEAITLAGQSFYVRGPVRPASAGEWTAGLKIGKATYDERLHAWWLVLDDFSGGIGYRRLDIREALGTVWDNPGGVDLRRPGHVTLPPLQTTTSLSTAPTRYDYTKRQPSVPVCGSDITQLANYFGIGSNIYQSTNGGVTLTSKKVIANAYMIAAILEFCEAGGTTALYCFCEGGNGTARYQKSTDGASWVDGGTGTQKVVEDAIVFDEKIIGTRPIAQIIFSTDGATWNIDAAADGEPLWQADYGRIQFVGIYMAPWGQPAVYFLARGSSGLNQLHVLDYAARKAFPIAIGNYRHIHDAQVWNNYIVVTDAYNVWLYDGVTVRNITWPRKGGGLPPSLAGAVIVKIIGGTDTLFVALYTGAGAMQILAYNGAGWSQLGPAVTSLGAVIGGIPSEWVPPTVATERRVWLGGAPAWNSPTSAKYMHLELPDTGEKPVKGTDSFHDGPLSFRTGWIDGGFRELSGALYKLYCDGYNIDATETVKIGYRLDNDEGAAFTELGTFVAPGTALTFPGSGTGLEFRTVQFEITVDRDATATNTPELAALVLLYDKKPDFRSSWTLRIDVNQMKAEGTLVGGSAATVKNVWEKLISIWDTKTLVVLNVPNIDTSVYVKITDMMGNFDDFRDAVAAQGYVDILCLEPI